MKFEKVLKKAIKSGYDFEAKCDYMAGGSAARALILIDPEFWQAVGKSFKWTDNKIRMCVGCGVALRWNENPTIDGKHSGKNGCGSDIVEYEGQWLIEMHRLLDYLAEGRTVEEFFKNLI
jgi:hypothetical protein